MDCPECNLENPSSALRCDCGYAFTDVPTTDGTMRCPLCAERIKAAAINARSVASLSGLLQQLSRRQRGAGYAGVILGISEQPASFTPLRRLPKSLETHSTHPCPEQPFAPPPILTRAEYNVIREGMTYEQVRKGGQERSRSDLGGFTTVMYSWTNANGSNTMARVGQVGTFIKAAW
jgi:hypothetical protein